MTDFLATAAAELLEEERDNPWGRCPNDVNARSGVDVRCESRSTRQYAYVSRDDLLHARSQILAFWRTAELFSPQGLPKVSKASSGPLDRQVVEWRAGDSLPWQRLPAPPPRGKTKRIWRHTAYVGVYDLDGIYDTLQGVFGEDSDAYSERPGAVSACAGLVFDHAGRLVVDASVLSSTLWAIGRAHDPGPSHPGWMDGFEGASEHFVADVDGFQGGLRQAVGQAVGDEVALDDPPPCDSEALLSLTRLAHRSAGIAGISSITHLATQRVIVESVAISASKTEEAMETDFLNSFYLDDLALVRARVEDGDLGAALASYLTSDADINPDNRVDIVSSPRAVDSATSVGRLPEGRWPSNPDHALALSQQFAVNEALGVLGPVSGLMGVNGPPGTGKTTMLRDILAGNIVERAGRLAALAAPGDAFIGEHRWTGGGGHPRVVPQLRRELTGFEMVVASANNAAVENITAEIPARQAIHPRWLDGRGYFTELATTILQETSETTPGDDTEPPQAWALVAATLGSKRRRTAFRGAFWFDTGSGPDASLGMQTILKQWAQGTRPRRPWSEARDIFQQARSRVQALLAQRRAAEARLDVAPLLQSRVAQTSATIDRLMLEGRRLQGQLDAHEREAKHHDEAHELLERHHDRVLAVRPTALETFLSLGRANRAWREEIRPAATALAASESERVRLSVDGGQLRNAWDDGQAALSAAGEKLAHHRAALADNAARRAEDTLRYGAAYPEACRASVDREARAPWLDADLDAARAELFLAALALHEDFIAATASVMGNALRAASEVIVGSYPRDLEEHKIRAAWQIYFLVVPLVSTTFASAGRMFGDLGREAIGWLLIDEAGQAAPQYAAGSIWRAQRVLVVGDPMQLEPVVSIPQKAQRDIARHYGASPTWLAPKASVQTLADRVATHGTYIKQGEEEVWVSAPLRVHRRCDDPMFSVANKIAYDGLMVHGVVRPPATAANPDRFDGVDPRCPVIAASHWAHEPADRIGTHLQPRQIVRLQKALAYLFEHGVAEKEIIVISPFRAVADRLRSLAAEDYPAMRAGTIHTAQGREAPVVILVLGGDPASPGAKAWAAQSPNLVNVAVTRAQRRLYVIGDREAWEKHPHFRELSKHLRVRVRPGPRRSAKD